MGGKAGKIRTFNGDSKTISNLISIIQSHAIGLIMVYIVKGPIWHIITGQYNYNKTSLEHDYVISRNVIKRRTNLDFRSGKL